MKIPFLKAGSTIGLVAPAGSFDVKAFESSLEILTKWGYYPVYSERVFKRQKETAGSEWERALDIIEYLKSKDIDGLWCIRGGYGSFQTLRWLYKLKWSKPIIGYSDITFIHLFIHNFFDQITFHGPNFVELATFSESFLKELFNSLSGNKLPKWFFEEENILRHGISRGRLLGGNLTCLCHMIGTPYLSLKSFERVILFIEDVNEPIYKVDRLLTHLKESGILKRIGGLLVGTFKNSGSYSEVTDRILKICKDYTFPIVKNFPVGHGIEQLLIPEGLFYRLDTYKKVLVPDGEVYGNS